MSKLSSLPDDLYIYILSYNGMKDQLSFTLTNKGYSNFLKYVRKFSIGRYHKRLAAKISNPQTILHLIANPYHQLNIIVGSDETMKLLTSQISCSELLISNPLFTESSQSQFQEIKRLVLKQFEIPSDEQTFHDELHQIIHSMVDPHFKLQELSLSNSAAIDLPSIPHLKLLEIAGFTRLEVQGLHLSDYTNLHCLKLDNCPRITKIDCLDSIPELHVRRCNSIEDISCLQHNNKIVIEWCQGIVDYSKSFQYSKVISIKCVDLNQTNLNFSNLNHVREIEVKESLTIPGTRFLSFPICSSLRSLWIHGFKLPFEIPENNLQCLTIIACSELTSLSNMGHIYSLKLRDLTIKSLSGLGRGNRIVEITRCARVSDFSPLTSCESVSIITCEGFVDATQLAGMKELKVELLNSKKPPLLDGVTHLELNNLHSALEFPIALPRSLMTLVFKKVSNEYLAFFPAFLLDLPQITKVVVHLEGYNFKEYFIERSRKNKLVKSQFAFEVLLNPTQLVLLKRSSEVFE